MRFVQEVDTVSAASSRQEDSIRYVDRCLSSPLALDPATKDFSCSCLLYHSKTFAWYVPIIIYVRCNSPKLASLTWFIHLT